jgi:glutamate dehydrogenase
MNDTRSKERYLGFITGEIDRRAGGREQPVLKAFAAEVLRGMDFEDLRDRNPADVCGTITWVWDFLQHWDRREPKIALFNPVFEQHGWSSRHTSILVLTDGMPFVAESLRLELTRRGIVIHMLASSDLTVQREDGATLRHLWQATVEPDGERRRREALVYIEVSRISDPALLAELSLSLGEVIDDVKTVVGDFEPMVARVRGLIAGFAGFSHGIPDEQWQERRALLEWLLDRNFTFLGCEELRVDWSGGEPRVETLPATRLGLLRGRETSGAADLATEIAAAGAPADLHAAQLLFFKSARRSRVHRIAYPDYITVKQFDADGRVCGMHRFLGLFTAVVYTMDPDDIPVVRRKVAEVIERSAPSTSSHRLRTLERVLEVLPRDELFQMDVDALYDTAMRIFHIQERRKIRLFVRTDRRHRFASCLVYWPRDIYRTELRQKIESLLMDALGAEESEFTTFFSESVLVRTHFVMRLAGEPRPGVDEQELEQLIVRVSQQWQDQLEAALIEEFGEERGTRFYALYRDAIPAGYRDDNDPPMAVADIRKIDEMPTATSLGVHLYRGIRDPDDVVHFRVYNCERKVELSEVVPMFENLGMRVLGERPYRLPRADGHVLWVHDFSLVYALAGGIDVPSVSAAVEDAFLTVLSGRAENDGFNRLIIGTGLGWREVSVLRAYAHFMKQLRWNFSQHFIAETLGRHLGLARSLFALFAARFDPALDPALRESRQAELAAGILESLERVEQLNEDQILRAYLALIRGTLRTNCYQADAGGAHKPYLSFKFDCAALPDVPRPVPMFEIWVYSPRVEGVHLRRGRVARGGLRWSDRAEDFRTEVLGLVKAQQVKNAVIVPVGAKGGFVPKLLRADMGRDQVQAEGTACYELFVQGLLDLTDNVVEGRTVPPPQVVCHDEPDPYLVVAADKGTASFSDTANAISARYGFWLRDAFASGGSVGYDHKKMAITARGAWVSVQRHFRELGVDVQATPFTVVGIGDMSGDVFGNGLLRSRCARLVAAFDHRHVFVDPDPDPEASFRERERLFALPRSSWADYDASLISTGGGVFPRSAKSIAITPEMRRALGIEAEQLAPAELVSAILAAPVDLVWNGGIGTYYKASGESHADVGDKSNDAVRVDAARIRAKVVGEGGNLGMTQLARIEFAARGGACNTDFIDNSGGVDCSDHEVNIKILLNQIVAAGDMTEKQRVRLLEEMRDEVAELVLRNNYRQTQAISIAVHEATLRNNEYRALISSLEAQGHLDRALEFLPADDVLLERRQKGRGLTRPELAVLTCYVKGQLKLDILASDIPENAYLALAIESAFPRVLAERYREAMYQHKLRREIVATQLANDVVDFMGITFIERMTQSTGATPAEIVRAFVVAREVFDLRRWWQGVEALDNAVPAARQVEVFADLQRLIRLATRWFIRNRRAGIDARAEVEAFAARVREIQAGMRDLALGEQRAAWERRHGELREAGLPAELAHALAGSTMLIGTLGMVEVARAQSQPVEEIARIAFDLNERLGFHWFGKQITALKVENYWQAMARESFLDELDWQVRAVVGWVARVAGDGVGSAERLDRWMHARQGAVGRWQRTLEAIRTARAQEYAMYAVAVRSLLELAQPPAGTP